VDYKKDFIAYMAEAGVLKFGEFTTKSGRQSPYFINTGLFNKGGQIAKLGEFYAACIMANIENGSISKDVSVIFGPAYKGIPLSVATSIALAKQGLDIGYCFNRKEAKDHGEGGSLVGAGLKDGDKVLVIDDVITAGTAIREVLPVIAGAADVQIAGLVISVDRMEVGKGDKSAVEEVEEDLGVPVFPIVTVRDIIGSVEGENRVRIEAYLEKYGSKEG
jgi:orotate phosphoribosyltransferase